MVLVSKYPLCNGVELHMAATVYNFSWCVCVWGGGGGGGGGGECCEREKRHCPLRYAHILF